MQDRYGLPAELVVAQGIPFRTVCEHHLLLQPPGQTRATDQGFPECEAQRENATLIRSTSTPGGQDEYH